MGKDEKPKKEKKIKKTKKVVAAAAEAAEPVEEQQKKAAPAEKGAPRLAPIAKPLADEKLTKKVRLQHAAKPCPCMERTTLLHCAAQR